MCTLYVYVRANGTCYTVLLEPGRATSYLQADLDTTATLRGYSFIHSVSPWI
jgi:hypothetical protein